MLVDLRRTANLNDPTLLHHRDAVRHRQGFDLVVSNEDCRHAELLLNIANLVP